MEKFISAARSYAVTKESEAHILMHEEMMTELQEQTKLLKQLVKLEKAETAPKPEPEKLKVNTQKPLTTTLKTPTPTKEG
jgi:hypothetical protein